MNTSEPPARTTSPRASISRLPGRRRRTRSSARRSPSPCPPGRRGDQKGRSRRRSSVQPPCMKPPPFMCFRSARKAQTTRPSASRAVERAGQVLERLGAIGAPAGPLAFRHSSATQGDAASIRSISGDRGLRVCPPRAPTRGCRPDKGRSRAGSDHGRTSRLSGRGPAHADRPLRRRAAKVRTDDLAAHPIRALMARNPASTGSAVDDVIYGCANQAGEDNRNVARMALLLAGLPDQRAGRHHQPAVRLRPGRGRHRARAPSARRGRADDRRRRREHDPRAVRDGQGRPRRSRAAARSTTPRSAGASSTR